MATIFDILNTLNNNNFENCKRQCSTNKSNKTIIDILPPMDVTMTNDKLIIETELAGISKDQIEIDIKDSILTIQGEKKKNLNKQQQQLVIEKSSTSPSSSTLDSKENGPSIEEFEDDIKPKSTTSTTTVSTATTTKENKEDENKTKSSDKKFISERSFGNFKRYLDLTKVLYQLDLNSINTQFENGLLTITINKKLHYSNTIKININ
ncbi:heat shock protein Hsp20 domain-containing protein [Dictyostelium discoideum AX4]|uniref:Small heat shock protein hspG7 n=1 Tax=Dictyostelium discoideum TaxID=44689 RepID=HSPG7_DICDI|nr:heat shock protein Hsp20 domain-containing protein [Dictyostelium discoideum AX4]Q8MPA5.2 RecName: Full=Small heat shock protein hspG7 [Dictyostelium discoideum]EAL68977.1 heat shock protein Hsp20 domain-containing protein [Dictyostelium discoideum AX4]|eukprot:XP_642981.1 heat shock protein Hsp20 domain-containing protein [Dictyostelium discoideum AX4]